MSRSQAAQIFYSQGKFNEAAAEQRKFIEELPENHSDKADAWTFLGVIEFSLKKFDNAVAAFEQACALRPSDHNLRENLGATCCMAGRPEKAFEVMKRNLDEGAITPNLLDGLAEACFKLERWNDARRYGNLALYLKDAMSPERPHGLPEKAKPAFDHSRPERNIIAFSLWGSDPRYVKNAIHNIRALPYVYPGWTCRFYVDDSVPQETVNDLLRRGAQVVKMGRNQSFQGLFWRFHAANDENADYFMCRDADSILNIRERCAVDEWLASDKLFHVMRDHLSHSEIMLAGMWGGVCGLLPEMGQFIGAYKPVATPTKHIDQWFLRTEVWPIIRHSVMIHDSHYDLPGTRRFPGVGVLAPGWHVGVSPQP